MAVTKKQNYLKIQANDLEVKALKMFLLQNLKEN